jgi:hypothetical protein
VRPHRRGAGGKSTRVLDLIEHHWDEIEADLSHFHRADALDWVRGYRPWNQFLRLAQDVAQRQGSRLRAVQLRDPRYLAEVERLMEHQQATNGEPRPSLEEWTPEVEALYMVANDVRLLTRAMAKIDIGFHRGPETPADIIAARRKQVSLSKIRELTGEE